MEGVEWDRLYDPSLNHSMIPKCSSWARPSGISPPSGTKTFFLSLEGEFSQKKSLLPLECWVRGRCHGQTQNSSPKAQDFSPVFRSWFCPPIPPNLKRILGSVCGTLSPSSDHSQNEIPIIGMRSWLWQRLEHQAGASLSQSRGVGFGATQGQLSLKECWDSWD